MRNIPLFALGRLEVTPAGRAALAAVGLDPAALFDRHARGDWGDRDDWLHAENDAAVARRDLAMHPIRSRYRVGDTEILVITAMDRSHTRLQTAAEYPTREVSAEEGYAAWAPSYDVVTNPLAGVEEPAVDALVDALPPAERVADVGTGTGRHALRLARRGARVTGFDASPEMLAVARRNAAAAGLETVRFEQAVLGAVPLPAVSNAFDLLVCGLMLCHVPDLEAALRECVRVVRPGGHLLITDFHPAAVAWGWRTAFPTPAVDYRLPNLPHTRQDYLDALAAAGAVVLQTRDISVGGEPYGDVSPAAVRAKGVPPLCLVISARKRAPI
jgi:ubiquinone/menaquinone biosynthesis C-methylase UbiE